MKRFLPIETSKIIVLMVSLFSVTAIASDIPTQYSMTSTGAQGTGESLKILLTQRFPTGTTIQDIRSVYTNTEKVMAVNPIIKNLKRTITDQNSDQTTLTITSTILGIIVNKNVCTEKVTETKWTQSCRLDKKFAMGNRLSQISCTQSASATTCEILLDGYPTLTAKMGTHFNSTQFAISGLAATIDQFSTLAQVVLGKAEPVAISEFKAAKSGTLGYQASSLRKLREGYDSGLMSYASVQNINIDGNEKSYTIKNN